MRTILPILACLIALALVGASGLYRIASDALGDSTSAANGWILATTGGKNGEGFYVDPSTLAGSCYWQRNGTILTPATVSDTASASTVVGEDELWAGTLTLPGQFILFDGDGEFSSFEQPDMASPVHYRCPTTGGLAELNKYLMISAIVTVGPTDYTVLTWASPAGTNPIFKTIDCPIGTDPVADLTTDTLELLASDGIDIAGDASADRVTFSATGADSTTIDYTSAASPTWDVIKQMSITSDASGLKLSGDATSPGTSYFYGTNGAGTKGWYAQSDITPDTDTDTDTECYTIYVPTAITLTTSYQQIGNSYGVCATGTAIYSTLIFNTWTVSTADTVTVCLYVDGVATDTWTTNAGATGAYGGTFSEAITAATASASHYISIYAKKTQVGAADTIAVSNSIIHVRIL